MKKLKAIIQGEVVIKEVEELPGNKPGLADNSIVAYGETGNAHELVGGKFNLYGNFEAANKYLEVIEKTELQHGNGGVSGHEKAVILPGVYEITSQVESNIVQRRITAVVD